MLISAEIGVFLPKFCFVNLRQLSVNRNSVSVNFTETIYGRTLEIMAFDNDQEIMHLLQPGGGQF